MTFTWKKVGAWVSMLAATALLPVSPLLAERDHHHHPHVEHFMGGNENRIHTDLFEVRKNIPEKVVLGSEFEVVIHIEPYHNLADVVITDQFSDGLEYVSSNPPAVKEGDKYVWRFDYMADGEIEHILIKVRATGAGDQANCFTAHAVPKECVSTWVGQAELQIEKSGTEEAMLGGDVDYTIIVHNKGTMDAKDVVVKDMVPDGFSHSSGDRELSYDLGTIKAGRSKSIDVDLKANERGTFTNVAVVESSNAGSDRDTAKTIVYFNQIELRKTGPAEEFIGKPAYYEVVVKNTGDRTLNDVVIRDDPDGGMRVISSDEGDVSTSGVVWRIDSLKAGEEKRYVVSMTSKRAGKHCNNASVSTANGVSDSAEACTHWKGKAALLIEMIDTEDPLLVGEKSSYEIVITNQGSADDTNVTLSATFPPQLKPIRIGGDHNGEIRGQTVVFDVHENLPAGARINYMIEAEAQGVGDGRVKVQMDSDTLQRPVTEEESTQVY